MYGGNYGSSGGYGAGNPYGSGGGGGGYGGYGRGQSGQAGGGAYQSNVEMTQYDSSSYGSAPPNPAAGGLPSGPRAGGLPSRPSGGLPSRPGVNRPGPPTSAGSYGSNPFGDSNADSLPSNPTPANYDSNAGNGGYGGGMGYNASGGGGADILNSCSEIDRTLTSLEAQLRDLQSLQTRILSDRAPLSDLDEASSALMSSYRALTERMREVKSSPEAGAARNASQVGRVDRRLKAAMNEFQRVESGFRGNMREQQARQYRIVNPAATEDEVERVVEDPGQQVFTQALISSDRRGQSQTTLNAVRARHAAIQNIERQMLELAELFQDLDNLVVQQETQVAQIETKGEEIQENVVKGNEELDTGIKSARSARKKKWICFWLAILLLLVIGGAVAIYVVVNKKPGSNNNNNNNGQPAQVTVTAAPVAGQAGG